MVPHIIGELTDLAVELCDLDISLWRGVAGIAVLEFRWTIWCGSLDHTRQSLDLLRADRRVMALLEKSLAATTMSSGVKPAGTPGDTSTSRTASPPCGVAAASHCSPCDAPPSTGMAAPVTNFAASEHRNAARRPKSSGSPITPAGTLDSTASRSS